MKLHLLAILMAMFTLTSICFANNVTINSDFQTGNTCMEINLSKNLTNQFGVFAYAAQTENWGEAYVGPTYSPNSNIQIGIGAGIESNQPSTRFGGFVWAGHGQFSLLALGEDGGSGKWYRLEGKFAMDGKTTIGVLQEIYADTGVIIERKLDDNTTLRVRLYKEGRGDVGLKLAF